MLACLLISQIGCSTTSELTKKDYLGDQSQWVNKVVTLDGTLYEFKTERDIGYETTAWWGAKVIGDSVKGKLLDGTPKSIPLSDVKMVYVTKSSPVKTIGLVGLCIGSVMTLCGLGYIISFNNSHF